MRKHKCKPEEFKKCVYKVRLSKDEKLLLEQVANFMECDQADIVRSALDQFYNIHIGLEKKLELIRMIKEDIENGQL